MLLLLLIFQISMNAHGIKKYYTVNPEYCLQYFNLILNVLWNTKTMILSCDSQFIQFVQCVSRVELNLHDFCKCLVGEHYAGLAARAPGESVPER